MQTMWDMVFQPNLSHRTFAEVSSIQDLHDTVMIRLLTMNTRHCYLQAHAAHR